MAGENALRGLTQHDPTLRNDFPVVTVAPRLNHDKIPALADRCTLTADRQLLDSGVYGIPEVLRETLEIEGSTLLEPRLRLADHHVI
jgi:hypothetical protein